MKNTLMIAALTTTLALLTGCGSSSNSSSSSTSSATTAPAAASTTSSTSSTSTSAATAGVILASKHGKLGTILSAGPKHLTVYMFEADKGGQSACTGACEKVWPPVTTSGRPSVAGQANQADISTVTRSDGSMQVTYKGHPLYFYGDDKDAGDAYGQGSKAFGAGWYVLKPSGAKIDQS